MSRDTTVSLPYDLWESSIRCVTAEAVATTAAKAAAATTARRYLQQLEEA
jgi:hypothetical protein